MYSLQESFICWCETSTHLAEFEVVSMVRRLAKKELCRACSPRLAHSEIWKFEAGTGEDPFAKVKGVITDLFGRLQEEASTEARQKARCDEETSKAAVSV